MRAAVGRRIGGQIAAPTIRAAVVGRLACQLGRYGLSKPSAQIQMVTAAITASWLDMTTRGNSIRLQQEPKHQHPERAPNHEASRSAAPPKVARDGRE